MQRIKKPRYCEVTICGSNHNISNKYIDLILGQRYYLITVRERSRPITRGFQNEQINFIHIRS